MSYTSKRDALGRQSLNIVELDLDTKITTGGKEYLCDGLVPNGQMFWPCVQKIEWVPTRAAEDGGLGYFGQVVITCKDFDYPNGAGTYFGRLLANNVYYLDRVLKIWVGFFESGDTFNFSDFQERRYFIQKIIGPDQNRNIKIEALDVLSQLKKGLVPPATFGALNVALDSTTTGTLNIQDNTNFVNATRYALIDDEIVQYTSTSGGDSIVVSARAQLGTKADSHDANAPVKMIYTNDGNVVDAIRDLVEDHSEIDHATYLPDTDWNAERDNFLSSETVALRVLDPTPTDQIIDKLGKQAYVNAWWDDVAKEIKLKAIGPTLTASTVWNDSDNILEDRITLKRDQNKVYTRVIVHYGKKDPTKGNSADNYDTYIKIDSTIETDLGKEKTKIIYADTIPASGSTTASKIASRIIAQNKTPIDLSLLVDAKDSDIDVGDSIDISSDLLQGTDGLPQSTKLRVIEKSQQPNNRYKYRMVFSGIEAGNRYPVIAPGTVPDYLSATTEQQNTYGWIADTDDEMSNGDDPYLII